MMSGRFDNERDRGGRNGKAEMMGYEGPDGADTELQHDQLLFPLPLRNRLQHGIAYPRDDKIHRLKLRRPEAID